MRHLLLALMIVLLPVRGWMGDAMAVAMLAAPAHSSMNTAASSAPPCPEHAMASEAPATSAHANADGDDSAMNHHVHKSCEVCNGPAMALSTPVVPALAPRHGLLAPPAERFASSEPQRGHKPPIS
ncbi:DUF2946 family protein [Hydrogenophaga palleronii]|uniref:DUF2946 family protein n=1 Tax=Hydrogenophaga palleronii TaxID=65655 RepID=UPI0008267C21|nr:DUF2946 domain-containing protein [Hydrogenophaga palleronii]